MGKVLEVTGECIPPGGCSVGLGMALWGGACTQSAQGGNGGGGDIFRPSAVIFPMMPGRRAGPRWCRCGTRFSLSLGFCALMAGSRLGDNRACGRAHVWGWLVLEEALGWDTCVASSLCPAGEEVAWVPGGTFTWGTQASFHLPVPPFPHL